MAVKKPASAKRKTATKKTAAKKPPVKSVSKPATKKSTKGPAAKKSTAKKSQGSGRGGFHRELNEETGFVVGTDQDAIALALLEGGESRAAIVEYLESSLDTETRNGTQKQIPNMVSGVLNKMLDRGFTIESSFVVLPPTPASKRAAAKRANAKPAPKKAAAKKTSARKPAAKKGAAKGKRR